MKSSKRSNRKHLHRQVVRRATGSTVEQLELRRLLASDFTYDVTGRVDALEATLTRTGNSLQLVEAGGQVLQSLALTDFTGNVDITGGAAGDTLTLDPSLGTIDFARFFIDGNAGNDTVLASGSLSVPGGEINLDADTITLAGVTFDTTSPTRPAGDITLAGTNLSVTPGSALIAAIDGQTAGDVQLTVEDATSIAGSFFGDLSPVLPINREATILLDGATVTAGDVTIGATAATKTSWDNLPAVSDGIVGQLAGTFEQVTDIGISAITGISGQVKVQKATGTITLTNTTVDARGDVEIQSLSTADASFTTVAVNSDLQGNGGQSSPVIASIGFGQANTTAHVTLDGTTHIVALGDVSVGTSTDSAADVSARGTANGQLSKTDNVNFAIALAIALTNKESIVTTGSGTHVQSITGNVRITADGTSSTSSDAAVVIFKDGIAGFSVGVSVDKATVRSRVDGTVLAANPQASQPLLAPAGFVDTANDSITFLTVDPDRPLERGDEIIYDDASVPILGLTVGDTYIVADVVDLGLTDDGSLAQRVTLARARTLDLDATQTSPASTHSIGKVALATIRSESVLPGPNATIGLANGSFVSGSLQTGDTVTYNGAASPVRLEGVGVKFVRSAAGDRIEMVDADENFRASGFLAGQQITVTDADVGFNNRTYTIRSISDDGRVLQLVEAEQMLTTTDDGVTLSTIQDPATIPGLVVGEEYRVDVQGPLALLVGPDGNRVPFTGQGNGLQGFSLVRNRQGFTPAVAVDSSRDTIFLAGHGYASGDLVAYRTDPTQTTTETLYGYKTDSPNDVVPLGTVIVPDAPIDGLADLNWYYVTVVDANTIRLSESSIAAINAAPIDLQPWSGGVYPQQTFRAPSSSDGITISATLDTSNAAGSGAGLSDQDQSFTDVVVNAGSSPENLIAGFVKAKNLFDTIKAEFQTRFGAKPFFGPEQQKPADTGNSLELTGTFSVNVADHTVEAIVGPNARVQTAGDLDVTAQITADASAASSSEATRAGQDQSGNGGAIGQTGASREDVEISAAFAYQLHKNKARARIEDGAIVDAGKTFAVSSDVSYPLRLDDPVAAINPAETVKDEGLNALSFLVDGTLGLGGNLFNSWVTALGGNPDNNSGDKFVLGFGINIQTYRNESLAHIGNGVMVNQDASFHTDVQTVAVTADTLMRIVDVGNISALNLSLIGLKDFAQTLISKEGPVKALRQIINPFGVSGRNAVGPSVVVTTVENSTIAEVGDDTRIRTGPEGFGLTVDADHDFFSTAVAQTGARASDFGVTASVTVLDATVDTFARIGNDVYLLGQSVTVDALDTFNRYAIDGAITLGEKIGIGASLGLNFAHRTTQAHIGADTPNDGSPGGPLQIDVAGPVKVHAENAGDTFALAIAGATLTDPKTMATPSGANRQTNPAPTKPAGVEVAVGASVAVNLGERTAEAWLDDTNIAASGVELSAINATNERAIVVGGAIAIEGTNASQSPTGKSTSGEVGVGGAFAVNDFAQTTRALARHSEFDLDNTDTALTVEASNTSVIETDGGGIAIIFNKGKKAAKNVSVGVGFGLNDIEATTLAFVEDVQALQARGGASVRALFDATITNVSIGGAGAISTGGGDDGTNLNLSIAGAGAVNAIDSDTRAYIGRSTLQFSQSIEVVASDLSNIVVDAGGIALALSLGSSSNGSQPTFSFAAGVAINDIDADAIAYLEQSNTVSTGATFVSAYFNATIDALAFGGALSAGAGSGAFTGAGSQNKVTGDTIAHISDSQTTTNAGDLSVAAVNDSQIKSDAGGVGVALTYSQSGDFNGSGSLGIGAAVNDLALYTSAKLLQSSAVARHVNIYANTSGEIRALSIAGALSGTIADGTTFDFAGAGAGSGNDIVSTTVALLDGTTVDATGDIDVSAKDTATIIANAGAIAFALGIATNGSANINLSFGASIAINDIVQSADAQILDAEASGRHLAITAESGGTIRALTIAGAGAIGISTSGGFGLDLAGAGTGSGNSIESTTYARLGQAATTDLAGDLHITSSDSALIDATAIAGALAVDIGQGAAIAVGVSIARNVVDATTSAIIGTNVQIDAAGNVGVNATSFSDTSALTVAVGVSVAINTGSGLSFAASGEGAQSTNDLDKTVQAWIRGGADVVANDVAVTAADTSIISAIAGGGGIAAAVAPSGTPIAISIAAALVDNDVTNTVQAYIAANGTTVTAAGDVIVDALETVEIVTEGYAVSGAVAIVNPQNGISVGGSGTGVDLHNDLDNIVRAYIANNAVVTAGGDTRIEAEAINNLSTIAYGVAADVSLLGASAAIMINDVTADSLVEAYVDHATITAAGLLAIDAGTTTIADAEGTPVSVAAAVGGAGNDAAVDASILGTNAAELRNGAVVHGGDEVRLASRVYSEATAIQNGGDGGVISVALLDTDALVDQDVLARVLGASTVTGGKLRLLTYGAEPGQINSTHRSARTDVVLGQVGLGGGQEVKQGAVVDGLVQALIDNNATVEVDDIVRVDAKSTVVSDTDIEGGTGGAINASLFDADAKILGNVEARIGNLVRVDASTLAVLASADNNANSDLLVAIFSVAGGSDSHANAEDLTTTSATVGSGSDDRFINIAGPSSIAATMSQQLEAYAKGGAGGGGVGVDLESNAIGYGSTIARLDPGAVFQTGRLEMSATAPSRNAIAGLSTNAATVGVIGVTLIDHTAAFAGDTRAEIGDGATVDAANRVWVKSYSNITTRSDASGGSGGVVNVSLFDTTSSITGSTVARVGDNVDLDAGSLQVIAGADKSLDSTLLVANVTVVGGGRGRSSSLDYHDVLATIGRGSATQYTQIDSNALVRATSSSTLEASARGGTGAIISGDYFESNAASFASTRARLADNAQVTAGNLNVEAIDYGRSVSAGLDVDTGQFGVVGVQVIKSTALISGNIQAIVGNNATLTTPAGGSIVIDAQDRNAVATTSNSGGSGGAVNVTFYRDTSSIGIDGDWLQRTASIGSGVTIDAGNLTVRSAGSSYANADVFSLPFGLGVGVNTGSANADIFADSVATIGGNASITLSGHLDVQAAQLRAGHAEMKAAAGGAISVAAANARTEVNGSTLARVDNNASLNVGGNVSVQAIDAGSIGEAVLGTPSGGIVSVGTGTSTAVVRSSTRSELGNNIDLDAGGSVTVRSLARGEVDSFNRSDGGGVIPVAETNINATYAPRVSSLIDTGSTLDIGGSLNLDAYHIVEGSLQPIAGIGALPTTANFQSDVSVQNVSGGAVDVRVVQSNLVIQPQTFALLNARRTSAAGNVNVLSRQVIFGDAFASSDGGSAALSVSKAVADLDIDYAETLARVGRDSLVEAGNAFTLTSSSQHTLSAEANARYFTVGVGDARAWTTASIDGYTSATLDPGATVRARRVEMESSAQESGIVQNYASGFGSNGGSYAGYRDAPEAPRGVDIDIDPSVEVFDGASIEADTVKLHAHAPSTIGIAISEANAIGVFVTSAFADARVDLDVNPTVVVTSDGNRTNPNRTRILGRRGVDVLAATEQLTVVRNPTTPGGSLIPVFQNRELGETNVGSAFDAREGALFEAGIRDAASNLHNQSDVPALALYVDVAGATRFESDLNLISTSPELIIDAAGNVVSQRGVTFTRSGDRYLIDDIAPSAPGQVLITGSADFFATAVVGTLGRITLEQTFDDAVIRVDSGTLVLGDLKTYTDSLGVQPKVIIDVQLNQWEFDVAYDFAPSDVRIFGPTDPAIAGGIELTGTIDNPLGLTVLNTTGDVYSRNFAAGDGLIRTNRLYVIAGGTVGGTQPGLQDRLAVEIVEHRDNASLVNIIAGSDLDNDLYVGLRAIRRFAASGRILTLGNIAGTQFVAGGSADLLLLGGLEQTVAGPTLAPVQVLETSTVVFPGFPLPNSPRITYVTNHFRVSTSPGIALPPAFGATGNVPKDTLFRLGLVQAGRNIDIHRASNAAARVSLSSNVDLRETTDAGNVDASTDGTINLTEVAGDMRVGRVESVDDNVELRVPGGALLDVPGNGAAGGDANAEVAGVTLRLFAENGIGTAAASFDINSSNARDGFVIATSTGDIYLHEKNGSATDHGHLFVNQIASTLGDVDVRTSRGGIFDARMDRSANISGNNIYLATENPALTGDAIGTDDEALEIDSSYSGSGELTLRSDGRVNLAETFGLLVVDSIDGIAARPSVQLRSAFDTSSSDESIVFNGDVTVAALLVEAGDSFYLLGPYTLDATGLVYITVDNLSTGFDADVGVGASLSLQGTVRAANVFLGGGDDIDNFFVAAQTINSGVINVYGLAPAYPTFPGDVLYVDGRGANVTNNVIDVTLGRGTVTIDGYSRIEYYSIELVEGETNFGPRIAGVILDSSMWSPIFRDFADGGFGDSSALGYRVPTGAGQYQTLPWVNVDRLKVQFTADVGLSLDLGDFAIVNASEWLALDTVGLPMPSIIGLSYDPATFTATLQLSGFLPAAVFDLRIFAAGVADIDGNNLDGEWLDNVTEGPSGDGTAGGDFSFRLFTLPGDAVDQNDIPLGTRVVNTNDSQWVRDYQNGLINPIVGALGYDLRADLDGSGFINTNDSQYVRDQQNSLLTLANSRFAKRRLPRVGTVGGGGVGGTAVGGNGGPAMSSVFSDDAVPSTTPRLNDDEDLFAGPVTFPARSLA